MYPSSLSSYKLSTMSTREAMAWSVWTSSLTGFSVSVLEAATFDPCEPVSEPSELEPELVVEGGTGDDVGFPLSGLCSLWSSANSN